jgi:hypothetical protein
VLGWVAAGWVDAFTALDRTSKQPSAPLIKFLHTHGGLDGIAPQVIFSSSEPRQWLRFPYLVSWFVLGSDRDGYHAQLAAEEGVRTLDDLGRCRISEASLTLCGLNRFQRKAFQRAVRAAARQQAAAATPPPRRARDVVWRSDSIARCVHTADD